jgi:pimeloyl-ACP methyl ester carboxylesterase
MMKLFLTLSLSLLAMACGGADANNVANTATVAPTPAVIRGAMDTVSIPSGNALLTGSMYHAGKPNSPAVLLLHQWESDRHSYDGFAKQIQAKGFAVLSIDGRGFGDSTGATNGTIIRPGRTDADVKAMLGDVDAAFTFLSTQNNVDPEHVAIVGASYGSSLAIIYAADHPKVAAVALLSPGLNYFGNMPTDPAVKKFGDRPLLLIAADDDKESADSVRALAKTDPKAAQKVYPAGGHGTALFAVGLEDELANFLTANLQK